MNSINLPASRRWQTVGSYPRPRVTDRRAEWYLRWLDHREQARQPVEPPLRWLVEVLFVIFTLGMIAMVYAVAKEEVAKYNSTKRTTHETRR